jgi:short-subunit dehydrogenase
VSGDLALVTGASSGIGRELARLFAQDGYDLVLAAEDDGVHAVATELGAQAVQADLSTEQGVQSLIDALGATGRPLAAAALNAGVGGGHAFLDQDLATVLEIIDVNVRGTTLLAHWVLGAMKADGGGKVLMTSSTASTMPGAYQAVYNATKSYVQSLTEALQQELKDTGVTLTALMPGPVDTNFFKRADMQDTKIGQGPKDDPADVARQGYEAMQKGKHRVVAASLMSKAMEAGNKVLPDTVKAAAHKVMSRPEGE